MVKATVDNDTFGDNGVVAYTVGSCDGSTAISYTINNVPAGTYYVYAVAFVVGDPNAAPVPGDYVGFYPAGYPPATANVVIPAAESVNFDIPLMLYTGDGGGGSLAGTWFGTTVNGFIELAGTLRVTLRANNTITGEHIDGSVAGATHTLTAVSGQTQIFEIIAIDGTRGCFYVDNSFTH